MDRWNENVCQKNDNKCAMKAFKCAFNFHLIRYLILSGIEEFCLDIATELRRIINEIYVRISSIHEIDLTESQVCLIDMALYRGMSKQPLHLKHG